MKSNALQSFCVFLHRNGSILVKTREEQLEAPTPMSRNGGYWAAYSVDAVSKETAIWEAAKKALAMNYNNGLNALNDCLIRYLDDENYTVDEDVAESLEEASAILELLEVDETPLENLIKLKHQDLVKWVSSENVEDCLEEGWTRIEQDSPGQLSLLVT